jgi:hypothetical protein
MPTRKFTRVLDYPSTRLRFYLKRERNVTAAFVIQLEYNIQPSWTQPNDFHPVVRFDHDITGPHDVRDEGLHMDVLLVGDRKFDVLRGFPSMSLNKYPPFCVWFIEHEHDRLVREFEKRNGF